MLYSLLTSLVDQYSFLNVFKYLTFRSGLSVMTSLVVVFIVGGPLIKIFSKNMITGPIRQDGPIDHIIKKSGTPTMGGVIIIIGILFSTFLWADLTNVYIWTLIFVSLSLGGLGLLDDILKIRFKNSQGLSSRYKFLGQLIISSLALFILIKFSDHDYLYDLYFPFFKNFVWYMGLFFIPFGLQTTQIHLNIMNDKEFSKLQSLIEKNYQNIITYDEALNLLSNDLLNKLINKAIYYLLTLKRKISN